MVFDYLEGGAESERDLRRNRAAFGNICFEPKRLVDVSKRESSTEPFGRKQALPLVIAPTGLNGALWPDGDVLLARAAREAGIPFALSTASNATIEDVADRAGGELWFQLYVVHRGLAGASVPDTGWLIAPYVDPTRRDRDSLGRGTTPGEVAAAVAGDKRVQLEREARWSYLQGAFKDPYAAKAALDELVKREGWTSAASRIARDPGQLGELRGKVGWLASGAAKQERARAERSASALPGSLQRIGRC